MKIQGCEGQFERSRFFDRIREHLSDHGDEARRTEVAVAVRQAVNKLAPELRRVIRARFWEDQTVVQIARCQRISERTVWNRLEAGLVALRAILEARPEKSEEKIAA